MNIANQKIIELFYKMLKVRVFEEKLANLYEKGIVKTDLYLSIGQEAVSAGAIAAINGKDQVFLSHRNIAGSICLEMDIEKMFRDIMGKEKGYSGGVGGPRFIADTHNSVYGASSMPAGNVSIATGTALANKTRRNGNIVLSFIGDGAANEGVFSESVNMASMLKLPIVYLIENNEYAGSQSFKESSPVKDLASRASSYSIPGIIVDGNNVLDVYEAILTASKHARSGKGPIIVEAKTYRFSGYTLNDKAKYRDTKEVRAWFEKCPIKRLSTFMLENMVGYENDLAMMKSYISQEMDEIIENILNDTKVLKEEQIKDEVERLNEKEQIENELNSLLEKKANFKPYAPSEDYELPSIPESKESSEGLVVEDEIDNDKIFEEIRTLKNLFKERKQNKKPLSVTEMLENGHTHTMVANSSDFSPVDFSNSLRRSKKKQEKEKEEKQYVNNAQELLNGIFDQIEQEENTSDMNDNIFTVSEDAPQTVNLINDKEEEMFTPNIDTSTLSFIDDDSENTNNLNLNTLMSNMGKSSTSHSNTSTEANKQPFTLVGNNNDITTFDDLLDVEDEFNFNMFEEEE